jgi:hypothetical protein
MTQNKKGPAAIAVAPSRGSTNPTKDKEMNSTEDNTTSAAMPVPRLTDEQIADATADLETSIVDLKLMASIAADLVNRFFNGPKPDANANGVITMRFCSWERDRILFAVNDVEFRSRTLNEAYLLARYGEGQL